MQKICGNCENNLPEEKVKYCPHCGQKQRNNLLSVRELFEEMFAVLFNFDNKFFQTLFALFIPGRLTKRFFAGKRKSYVHPIRVMLVPLVILIFFLNKNLEKEASSGGPFQMYQKLKQEEWERSESQRLDTLKLTVLEKFDNNSIAEAAIDSLLYEADLDEFSEDSIDITKIFNFIGEEGLYVMKKDFFELDEDELMDKYGIEGFWGRMKFRQTVRVIKKGDRLLLYLIGNILWMIIVMMPMLALTMKLFYLRQKRYFTEHLIFAVHVHSFLFLLFTLALIFYKYLPGATIGWVLLAHMIYVMMSMRNYYGQSWRKTIFKFFLISFIYLIILTIAAVLIAVISLALF